MILSRRENVLAVCIALMSLCLFSSVLGLGVEKTVVEIIPNVIQDHGKNAILNLLETMYGGNNEEMLQGFYNTDVSSIFC